VERLLKILFGAMNRIELQQALKLTDREHFRINYLIPALEDEWIEMTIPEKPKSRNQKYRKTKKALKQFS
jgi:hypothetical protein